jgi:hypothetical protein
MLKYLSSWLSFEGQLISTAWSPYNAFIERDKHKLKCSGPLVPLFRSMNVFVQQSSN